MNSERQELSFRFGQHRPRVHTHTHTHAPTHTNTREGNLSQHTFFERQNVPKRVRDEKEVREAKAERA